MQRNQVAFSPSWGKRIVGMEGLRALAAVGVLIGHVKVHTSDFIEWGLTSPFMYVLLNGLTLFFALSGFLLFRPFASALITGERFPLLGRYAVNRALRIYPGYIVIMLLVALVVGTAYAVPQTQSISDSADLVGYMTDPKLLLINATMLQTFFPFSIKTGLGVAWSLTVELMFYVVMPLLAILAMRMRRRADARIGLRWAILPVALVFFVGLVGKLVKATLFGGLPQGLDFFYEWGGNWYAVLARSFPVHADLFAFGMLAAVIVSAFEAGRLDSEKARLYRWGSFIVAGLSIGLSVIAGSGASATLLAVAFGSAILFVALPDTSGRPGIVARCLEFLPIRYVGLVSYSFYLWHLPVIWLIVKLGWTGPETVGGFLWNLLLVFLVTLAFASVTYHFVEKPALRLKRRTDRKRAPLPR